MHLKYFITKRFSPLALATILACGAVVAWAFLIAWTAFVVDQMFSQRQSGESLIFTVDGRALMQSYHWESIPEVTYRTLDGQSVEAEGLDSQKGDCFLQRPQDGQASELSWQPSWQRRIVGFAQTSSTPADWYLLHDGLAQGHAYFQGFDPQTKHSIGYLGLRGFRSDVPSLEERFGIESRQLGVRAYASQRFSWGTEPRGAIEAVPTVFVASNGSLFHVDLQRQTVRPLSVPGEVLSLGNFNEPIAVSDDRRVTYKPRVAVRLPDRVLVMSFEGDTLRSIPLPREARDANFSFYTTTGTDSILVVSAHAWRSPSEIYWIGDHGDVARHEQLPLTSREENRRFAMWMVSGVLPMPAIMTFGVLTVIPWTDETQDGESYDYTKALARVVADAWPPLLALYGVSAILAVICFRRHRRYHETGGLAWAAFMLLFGVPGLVGYWLHRHWPVRERCAKCGAVVPRDRESCLACAAEFPAPALQGIEVFA